MHIISGLLAGIIVTAAASAAAQITPDLMLVPGEAVTIRVDAGGRVAVSEKQQAKWSAFDVVAARHLTGLTPPNAPVPRGTAYSSPAGDPKPEPVPPNQLRARFLSIEGRHSLLVIENGLRNAIKYRATMTVNGARHPTDVCVVLAGYPSYEHWPHPIERIELTDFRFVAAQPGLAPTCE